MARFMIARWLWLLGLLVGAAAVAALARGASQRRAAIPTGLALLGLVAAGALTPLVRVADAISYDAYSNVAVLDGSYVSALIILTVSALLIAWDLGKPLHPSA